MCDEICRKETLYLNPAFISRQQVRIITIFITIHLSTLIYFYAKLVNNYSKFFWLWEQNNYIYDYFIFLSKYLRFKSKNKENLAPASSQNSQPPKAL